MGRCPQTELCGSGTAQSPCAQGVLPAAQGQRCWVTSLLPCASAGQQAGIKVAKEPGACDIKVLPRNLGNKMILPEHLGQAVLPLHASTKRRA